MAPCHLAVNISLSAHTPALNYYVRLVTSNYLRTDLAKVPAEPIAIVFGAGVWEDGTPTAMLADRVQAAIELYKAERVSQLLITGDNSSKDYSEVKAMQEYAEAQGIAANDLTLNGNWKACTIKSTGEG
ncbi:ElyC/SanA/YdcF family protein [Microcoleus sp. BROC3]|uniref:ElyC/SanA/YdcF family protein n=1 Tax=Microcoleus sp. BROC3 TaxID=3055323 RepID=UPI002FD52529